MYTNYLNFSYLRIPWVDVETEHEHWELCTWEVIKCVNNTFSNTHLWNSFLDHEALSFSIFQVLIKDKENESDQKTQGIVNLTVTTDINEEDDLSTSF